MCSGLKGKREATAEFGDERRKVPGGWSRLHGYGGYIHSDSARCAVTGRLDVERLAASPKGRYLSYPWTTLPRTSIRLCAAAKVPAITSPSSLHDARSRSPIRLSAGVSQNSPAAITRTDFRYRANGIGRIALSLSPWLVSQTLGRRHSSRNFGSPSANGRQLFPVLSLPKRSFQRERETRSGDYQVPVLKSFPKRNKALTTPFPSLLLLPANAKRIKLVVEIVAQNILHRRKAAVACSFGFCASSFSTEKLFWGKIRESEREKERERERERALKAFKNTVLLPRHAFISIIFVWIKV